MLTDLADFALQDNQKTNEWSLFLGHGIMAHTAISINVVGSKL